jgi:hypothetical protein
MKVTIAVLHAHGMGYFVAMLALFWLIAGIMVFANRPAHPFRTGWRRFLP